MARSNDKPSSAVDLTCPEHSLVTPPKTPVGKATTGGERYAPRKTNWAGSLRKMYDDTVDEPLPDSFTDLLDKLDQAASKDPDS